MSAPNLTTTPRAHSDIAKATCMELALEGERLCQAGDLMNGVKFLEEAVKVGTSDIRILSATYSQLGNTYFYLENYQKALDYHKRDVSLVHKIGDEMAEAKACGNLGNTFKMMGKFDEAAVYCRRYLEICRKLKDKVGEGRALYNLGNVYHMQGKKMIGINEQESGELPSDIKTTLQRAIEYYEASLTIVSESKDCVSMGRAHGNLGNTHYLLGNFEEAVENHRKRLDLARQLNDKSAERRAHLNLGNAHVFLGDFIQAIENYFQAFELARKLQDKNTEAHSCYSLANTFTFLHDYNSAIEYHLKYLNLIESLDDKLGEGRACWSLVNIFQAIDNHESALIYAKRHQELAKLLADQQGLASAKTKIEELENKILPKQDSKQLTFPKVMAKISNLSLVGAADSSCSSTNMTATTMREVSPDTQAKQSPPTITQPGNGTEGLACAPETFSHKSHPNNHHSRLSSADRHQKLKRRPFKEQSNNNMTDIDGQVAGKRQVRNSSSLTTADGNIKKPSSASGHSDMNKSDDRLLELIASLNGQIDDQRCELKSSSMFNNRDAGNRAVLDKSRNINETPTKSSIGQPKSSFNSRSATAISRTKSAVSAIRATCRKATVAAYPALHLNNQQRPPTAAIEQQDKLFDMIASSQSRRMDEQRVSLAVIGTKDGLSRNFSHNNPDKNSRGGGIGCQKINPDFVPVQEDEFLDNLMRYQSTRFNDQRSKLQ